jgi:hypothetical protein
MSNEPLIDRAALRKLLAQKFTLSEDLDAFCLDYYPEIKKLFSSSMSSQEKFNLLLAKVNPQEILLALRRHEAHMNYLAIDSQSANLIKNEQLPASTISPTQSLADVGLASPVQSRIHLSSSHWIAFSLLALIGALVTLLKLGISRDHGPVEKKSITGRCDLGRWMKCLGAINLKRAVPSTAIILDEQETRQACLGFIEDIHEQLACSEIFDSIYGYADRAVEISNDGVMEFCKNKSNWIACLVLGNAIRRDMQKTSKKPVNFRTHPSSGRVCDAYKNACQYGRDKKTLKGCVPIYVSQEIYETCYGLRPGAGRTSQDRYTVLEELCRRQPDGIAAACSEVGGMRWVAAEDATYHKSGNAPILRKEAFEFFQRGCELRKVPAADCSIHDPLRRDCDREAGTACLNAARLLSDPSWQRPNSPTRKDFLIWATQQGNLSAENSLIEAEKSDSESVNTTDVPR